MLQRVGLGDRIALEHAGRLQVEGFDGDTIVTAALRALADHAGVAPAWSVRIWKAIPVAAGLGGGSSDAATALRLANRLIPEPLAPAELEALAATLGADVPFFLRSGPQLGRGDGSSLEPVLLPQDYTIVLVLPADVTKESTATVYRRFDARQGAQGFEERRGALLDALANVRRADDLARLPPNDLASSDLATDLAELGAFRADVSGAGPVVYGCFLHRRHAEAAARALRGSGRIWVTSPCWYG